MVLLQSVAGYLQSDAVIYRKGNSVFSCPSIVWRRSSGIDPKFNNVLVFHDLMARAKDSPLVSLLFTQGRYRNASVILLLQNMFPKGKFNTDTSRNAQYMALFRSPSDRKQIGIIAERMFDKTARDSCQLIFKKRNGVCLYLRWQPPRHAKW